MAIFIPKKLSQLKDRLASLLTFIPPLDMEATDVQGAIEELKLRLNGFLLGVPGGQTITGGTEPSDNLILKASSNNTDGEIVAESPIVSPGYKLSALNSAPDYASAPGSFGEIRVAADYIYVCIATNTWVRAAIDSWADPIKMVFNLLQNSYTFSGGSVSALNSDGIIVEPPVNTPTFEGGGYIGKWVSQSLPYVQNPTLQAIRTLLSDSNNGNNVNVTYIVSGDSTRDNTYNEMIAYYTHQLNKINVDVVNNASSGQSGQDWLNNTDQTTLAQAIAATSGTGQNTILEYSFGINDDKNGATREQVKGWLKSGIQAYLTAKPLASVVLVVPVYTADTVRNANLQSIYQEIAVELNLPLIDVLDIMGSVHGDSVYYFDSTHPNGVGSVRLANYILSWLALGPELSAMTLDNAWFTPPYTRSIATTVESGYWGSDGSPVANAGWRRMQEIAITSGFVIRVKHQGNRNDIRFLNSSHVFISSIDGFVDSEGFLTFSDVPSNAAYARMNISSNGSAYDALNDVPVLYCDPLDATMDVADKGLYQWGDTTLGGIQLQPSADMQTLAGIVKWYVGNFVNFKGYSNWPARTNLLYPSYIAKELRWSLVNNTAVLKYNNTTKWNLYVNSVDGAATTNSLSTEIPSIISQGAGLRSIEIDVTAVRSSNPYWADVQLFNESVFPVVSGQKYIAVIGVWSNSPKPFTVTCCQKGTPYAIYITRTDFNHAGTGWEYFEYSGTSNASASDGSIRIGIGASVNKWRFCFENLEAGDFSSPYIRTRVSAVTRPATNLTMLTEAIIPTNNFGLWIASIPGAIGQTGVLFSSYTDSNNYIEISVAPTQIIFTKVVAGVVTSLTLAYTHLKNMPVQIQAYQSTTGMGFRKKEQSSAYGAWVESTTNNAKTNAVIGSTCQVGGKNNANHFAGYFPGVAIIDQLNPKAELIKLGDLY